MKEKLLAILKLLDVFGVKTSDKLKSLVIISILLISIFNLQVNVKNDDYGYLNTDTIEKQIDTTKINYDKIDTTFIDLLIIDSIQVDSIKK